MTAEALPKRSVERRRALEALRAGVPNRDAVMVLGSMQQGVDDRFTELLAAVDGLPDGAAPGGMLVGGGFGSGKSHALEHLSHMALSEGFVVSKVVVSKETPLHDPTKMYRAAIEAAKVPGRPGSAIDEIVAGLRIDAGPTRSSIGGCTSRVPPSTAGSRPPSSCTSTHAATRSSRTGSCGSGPATRFLWPS